MRARSAPARRCEGVRASRIGGNCLRSDGAITAADLHQLGASGLVSG
jgi:hypothetical protein